MVKQSSKKSGRGSKVVPKASHPPTAPRSTGHSAEEQGDDLLFPGERITIQDPDLQLPNYTNEQIDQKYAKGELRIVTESARYQLTAIKAMAESGYYKLDPEYQRRHRWDVGKKSRLIESFIMNIPVPPIFLYEYELAKFEVMDGRQRFNAITEFYKDGFKLQGLEYWTELDGKTYSQLPSMVKAGVDRRYLSSIILLKETAKDEQQARHLKRIVFERLNSGGVKLEAQETRNALYSDSKLNQLCLRLSANHYFKDMWELPKEPEMELSVPEKSEANDPEDSLGMRMFRKMDDVELVLRFFAYRQIGDWPGASLNKLNQFLDKYLQEGNRYDDALLSQLEILFEHTVKLVFDLLGINAFRRWETTDKWSNLPQKIIYDPMMYVFSRYAGKPEAEALVQRKEAMEAALKRMYLDHKKEFEGRSTNRSDMLHRNRLLGEAISSVLDTSGSRR